MSGIFGGSSNSVQQEVYSGIQVSTSILGGCIPYVAGRQRIPSNLLWYGNFQVSSSSSGGGKGGGGSGTKTYSYSAAWISGLCIGPIQGVHQIWHDKALVTLTYENLALALGSSGQATWSGYPTGTPTVQKIPYDHIAYTASSAYNLGSSAAMPNLTYEVEGVVPSYSAANSVFDADPSAVVSDYLTDSVHGALAGYPGTPLTIGSSVAPLTGVTNSYQAYCMAVGLLTSPYETTQRQATDFISELMQCTNSQCRLSVGTLEIIPYADAAVSAVVAGTTFSYTPNLTPVYAFTDDDYCPAKDEPPVSLKQKPQSDTYNTVNVEFLDRSNYYNTGSANCSDLNDIAKYGARLASSLTWHQITQAAVAKTAGTLWLARQLYETNTYTFRVRSDFSLLEPLDYISLTDSNLGLAGQVCQITEIEESIDADMGDVFTITALELPGVTRTTAQYDWQAAQGYFANYATDPGPVQAPAIFVMPPIPASLSEGITLGIAVAGSSSNTAWLGCDVYCSTDGGSTFQYVNTIATGCLYGTITANIGAVADPDTTSTLSVALADTQLQLSTAATHADADAMRTLILVGTGSTAEVMSYGAASLVSAGHYNLTYLRRNLYGSTNQAHSSGAPFARLDAPLLQIAIDPGMAGQTIEFKFVSFNTWHNYGNQTLAGAAAYSYTVPAALPVSGAVRLIPRGNCAFTGEAVYKNSGIAAWDSDCVSDSPFVSGNISAQYGGSHLCAVGLVASTAATLNPTTNMDFAIYAATFVEVIESGTVRYTSAAAPAAGDLYDVRYDGFTIFYFINGVLVRSTPASGLSLFAGIAENGVGTVLSNVQTASGAGATPVQWKGTGNAVVNEATFSKIGGTAAWDSTAYSINGYPACHIRGKPNSASLNAMIGFSSTPTASTNFNNNEFCLYAHNGNWFIEEGASSIALGASVALTDVAWTTYDGVNVRYYLNDVTTPVHTTALTGATLYGYVPLFDPGAGWNSVEFGPTTNLAVQDTAQLGVNAASQIASAVNSAGGTLTESVAHAGDLDMVSVSVPLTGVPVGVDVTSHVTVIAGTGVTASGLISVFRDGAQVGTAALNITTAMNGGPFWSGQVTLTIDDTPAAGTHTYTMHIHLGAVGSSGAASASWDNAAIKVREYRR